jgi:hypothetical protein
MEADGFAQRHEIARPSQLQHATTLNILLSAWWLHKSGNGGEKVPQVERSRVIGCNNRISPLAEKDWPMNSDPRRVIVTETTCNATNVQTVQVHHQNFPEEHVEDASPELAVQHLMNRLEASRGIAPDPLHRDALGQAIADLQAFVESEQKIRAR